MLQWGFQHGESWASAILKFLVLLDLIFEPVHMPMLPIGFAKPAHQCYSNVLEIFWCCVESPVSLRCHEA